MFTDLKIIFDLLEKYGVIGLVAIQLAVVIFCFWKLFANHLTHIQQGINDTKDSVEKAHTKIDVLDTKTNKLGERVANIEGQLEGPKRKAKLG